MAAETTNVLGHTIPHVLSTRVLENRYLAPLHEGFIVATVVMGGAWGSIWLLSFMVPFLPNMPGEDAHAVRILFRIGCVVVLLGSLFGASFHIRYRLMMRRSPRSDAALHRLVGYHRMNAAFMLLLFCIGAIVHSWNLSVWLAVVSALVLGLQLVIGYHNLPQRLGYVVYDPSGMTAKVVQSIEALLPILLVIGIGGPLINYVGSASSFAALINFIGLIGAPFIFTMLAAASIHLQAAHADVQ